MRPTVLTNARQVVGVSCDADFVDCRAVIWDHGNTPTDLNDLKGGFSARLETAKDINDKGEITGRAYRCGCENTVFGGACWGTLKENTAAFSAHERMLQAYHAGCRFIESTSGIFLSPELAGPLAPISRTGFDESPCLSTSQPAFVRLLSRSINDSFMRSLLRVLLLAALCCSSPLAHAEDPSPTRLKYGAWGFDLAGMDTATRPGDDFFRYANGTWIDKTQIPPDKPAYSLRLAMTDLTEQRLHEMMESLGAKPNENPSTLEEKVGAFTARSWTKRGLSNLARKRSSLS